MSDIKLGKLIDELNNCDGNMDLRLCYNFLPEIPRWLGFNGLQMFQDDKTMFFCHDWSSQTLITELTVSKILWNLTNIGNNYPNNGRDFAVCHRGFDRIPNNSNLEPIRHLKGISYKSKSKIENYIDLVLLEFE